MLSTDGFFSRAALGNFGFRWLHILAGITWIGLLYYFNFVQVPAFAEYGDEARARNIAIDKVARRALWWFRWSALSTFVMGILITIVTKDYYANEFGKQAGGIAISTGMGPWNFVEARTWRIKDRGYDLRHVSRVESGSPATGTKAIHDQELADLMEETFQGF